MAGRRVYSYDFESFADLHPSTTLPAGAARISVDHSSGKEFFRLPATNGGGDALTKIAGRLGVQSTEARAKRAWQLYFQDRRMK